MVAAVLVANEVTPAPVSNTLEATLTDAPAGVAEPALIAEPNIATQELPVVTCNVIVPYESVFELLPTFD